MYHPPSKRKQLTQRITVYSLMSLAVIVLVSALAFFMLGYQFNRKDGRIEQGGLVQFDSRPTGAEVVIDGKSLGTRTTARATLAAGDHAISMQRTGYKVWQKSVSVVPGSVLWLNYARLVPTALKPTAVAQYKTVTSTAVSPDSKRMVIKDDAATPTFSLIDLTQKDIQPTSVTLPETTFSAPGEGQSQQFSLDSWDPSGRYLLVKHTYDSSKVEWLVVDIQNPDATTNLTTALGVDASKVVFSNDDSRKLYAQIDTSVRQIDLGASTLSGPLVTDVSEFTLYDKTVLYTTLPDEATKARSVGYYDEGASKPRILRSYQNAADSLHIAAGKYFNDTYVSIAHGETVEVMKGDLPKSDSSEATALSLVHTLSVPEGVKYLSDVTNGRFVIAQSAGSFVVYDLELKKTTTTKLHGTAAATKELRWLDEYTLWSDQDGTVRLYEFDGANQHDIMPVASGFNVTLSPSGTYLYGIAVAEDGSYSLTRVKMIL